MNKKDPLTKDGLTLFLTFLLMGSFIIGLMMFIGRLMNRDLYIFAQIYMLLPGAAVILMRQVKAEGDLLRKPFNTVYLMGTSAILLTALSYVITGLEEALGIISLLMLTTNLLILFIILKGQSKWQSENAVFKLNNHLKKSLFGVLIFILLYFAYILISKWIGISLGVEAIENFPKLKINAPSILLFMIPLFALNFLPFLGEELGWRFYLLPLLINKYSYKKGIILVGLIWGVWHLPLNLMLYSTQNPLLSLTNQIVLCLCYSIYFGFVYTKTQNIWAVTFIHFLTNNFVFLYEVDKISDLQLNLNSILLNAFVLVVLYVPFIFLNLNKECIQ